MITIEKKKLFGRKGIKELKMSFNLKEKEAARKEISKCLNDFQKYLKENNFKMQEWEKDWKKELKLLKKEIYELYLKDYFYIISIE